MDRLYRFVLTLIVIIIMSIIGVSCIHKILYDSISKKVIENVTSVEDVSDADMAKIVNTLSDEEKDKLKEITGSHASSIISSKNISEMIKTKNLGKLKQQIRAELTSEEIEELKVIYGNHRAEISSILAESN